MNKKEYLLELKALAKKNNWYLVEYPTALKDQFYVGIRRSFNEKFPVVHLNSAIGRGGYIIYRITYPFDYKKSYMYLKGESLKALERDLR